MPDNTLIGNPIQWAPYDRAKVQALFDYLLGECWDNASDRTWLVRQLAPDASRLVAVLNAAGLTPRQTEAVCLRFALTDTREARTIGETAAEMGIGGRRVSKDLLPAAQGKFVTLVTNELYLRAGARLVRYLVWREHRGMEKDTDLMARLIAKVAMRRHQIEALHNLAEPGHQWLAVAWVFGLRNGIPHTQAQTAEITGLSEHSVNRLIGAALSHIWWAGVMKAYNDLTI